MRTRCGVFPGWLLRLACVLGGLVWPRLTFGQDYLTPNDIMLPPEAASQKALDESATQANLRLFGLDFFPRAALSVMYDDNLLISPNNPLSDVQWTIIPGVTATAGDLSLYLPGPVTLVQVRDLLSYSLLDDSSRPQRYVGVEYAPAVNFFTEHNEYNNVDQFAGFSAGYAFSRLAIGLDQDFAHVTLKDNGVGDRVTQTIFDTRLQLRYGLTDRSYAEVNGRYYSLAYAEDRYDGYQEFRNEDWYNRLLGARMEVGLGAAFGVVFPENNSSQTYEQLLMRATYMVSGKLDLRGSGGIQFRQFDSGQAGTVAPVFNLAATYQPRVSTAFTLEGYRREEPSFDGDFNYVTLGFTLGVRQQLLSWINVLLAAGYENIDYVWLNSGLNNDRADNYYLVRASLQYDFNRHLSSALFWIYRQDASNLERYSYVNNMVGVRVNYYY